MTRTAPAIPEDPMSGAMTEHPLTRTDPTATAVPDSFTTPEVHGIRLGGLPATLLDDIGCPGLWQQVQEVLDHDRGLARDADALSQALYAVIGGLPAGPARAAVVALRRGIHNDRALSSRWWNDEVRALLPADLAEAVRGRLALRAARASAADRLDEQLAHHLATRHLALRKAVSEPALRHGVVLSSPALHDRLTQWLASPPDTVPDRRLALRLAKYLARVALKTSPFSTFTISGLGTWDTAPDPAGLRVRTTAELNVWVIQQVVRELSAHPALAATLRLRLNPAAHQADGRWEFLGPGPEEPLRTLAASPPVQICVAAVGDGARNRSELAAEVAARTGSTPQAADAYLAKLLEVGLLEAQRPFPDQAFDPLAELRQWVAGTSAALDAALTDLADALTGYPDLDDPTERLRRTERVTAGLQRVRTETQNLLAPYGGGRIDLPAKNGVIENALLVRPVAGPERRRWEPVLRDLDQVRRLYAVLDPALPGRVALADLFAETLGEGACLPYLSFHRAVQTWLRADPSLTAVLSIGTHGYRALPGHRLPRLRQLAEARDALCAEALGGEPDADGTLHADPERLRRLMAHWPRWLRQAPDSVTFYGQPLDPGTGTPRFVLNAVNSGHGRGRDRIARLLSQTGHPATADTAPPPEGTIVADTCRHFGSNVGLRDSLLTAEIDCPGGATQRPAHQRLRLGDLLVRRSPDTGLLTCHWGEHGVPVRPAHPSLIAELWLPPAIRLLMQVFGTTPNLLIPGRRMFGDPSLADVHTVLAQPRVTVGTVVVSRRQWVFPKEAVPVRERGESDRDHLLRLAAWLRTHGMPRRCFVRALDPDTVVGGSVWRVKSRKPLYVDFANPLLLGVFERLLADGEPVLFLQEALPGPADLPRYADSGARVTEHLIEISERQGGHQE